MTTHKVFCKCGHPHEAHSPACAFCGEGTCPTFQWKDRTHKAMTFAELYGHKPPARVEPVYNAPVQDLTWMEAAILTLYQSTIKPYIKQLEDRDNEAHQQSQDSGKLITFPGPGKAGSHGGQ